MVRLISVQSAAARAGSHLGPHLEEHVSFLLQYRLRENNNDACRPLIVIDKHSHSNPLSPNAQ
jgi:hypothetical protein